MELGTRGRIGLMVPSINTVAEPEMNRMRPEGVTVHAARMFIPADMTTLEAFVRMCEEGCRNARRAAETLSTAKVDAYAFAFTAGSFFRGAGWDETVAREIETHGRAPCVVTSTAAVHALRAYGVGRISVASPYAVGNGLLKGFLNQKGFEVAHMEGLTVSSAQEEGTQGIGAFRSLVERVDQPGAEAVFVSCTNFATIAALDEMEKSIGKPIISANQATFWAVLRKIGVKDKLTGYGRLLRDH